MKGVSIFVFVFYCSTALFGCVLDQFYQPGATPLLHSQEYIRTHPASTYWAVSSYHIGQQTECDCSLACATMALNVLLWEGHTVREERATEASVLKMVDSNGNGDGSWAKNTGNDGVGVTLDGLSLYLTRAFQKYGIHPSDFRVMHIQKINSCAHSDFITALCTMEEHGRSVLIVNFLESTFLRHPDAVVGHFAVVGAYDAQKQRVLLFDPDRTICEPYWVDLDLLISGMHTVDSEGNQYRGYIVVEL